MPELPEVETLRRELVRVVVGKTIRDISVSWTKMIRPLTKTSFRRQMKNKKIKSIARRAKLLVFSLSGGLVLLVHLKMTGQLIFRSSKLSARGGVQSSKLIVGGHPQQGGTIDLPNQYTRAVINFTDGSALYFNDLRKFGWMRLVNKQQADKLSSELGFEPLSKSFTFDRFQEILDRYPRRNIKHLLTDQTLIAGLGNIYADESCFCARIKPTRRVRTLSVKEQRDLFRCIPKVLKLAISKKGTSFRDYVRLDGAQGKMVRWLKVYNKAGQSCQKCRSVIKKIKLNGRGTHFCPKCQG